MDINSVRKDISDLQKISDKILESINGEFEQKIESNRKSLDKIFEQEKTIKSLNDANKSLSYQYAEKKNEISALRQEMKNALLAKDKEISKKDNELKQFKKDISAIISR